MALNTHRLKPVGCALWTESPDTRRLNDASSLRLHLEVVIRVRFEMVLQIRLDHLLGHLTHRGTKVPCDPKVSPQVPLLQVRKLLKQFACRSPVNPPYQIAGRHFL
jgi:hypothetical protein